MKRFLVIVGFLSLLLVPAFVGAQQAVDLGLDPIAQTGLGSQDIRITIATIIRIALGFVGVILLGVILYGGFLWMTAGGSADRVATAKKWLINGVIGLVITISAYAITSFVIRSIAGSTGVEITPGTGSQFGGAGGGGGSGLPSDAFFVRDISPQGNVSIRNVVLKVVFNKSVDTNTVTDNIVVSNASSGAAVAGEFTTNGSVVEFRPSSACPEPNTDRKCFQSDTTFNIAVSAGSGGVTSSNGQELVCGFGGSICNGSFTSGSIIDTQNPTVVIIQPSSSESVSSEANVIYKATVQDDAGVGVTTFFINGSQIDTVSPGLTIAPRSFDPQVNWDTSGILNGSQHSLYVDASDIAGNTTRSTTVSVGAQAAHCFDTIQNEDESGLDCGGSDCARCPGAQCSSDNECAGSVCISNACVALPTIVNVDPKDGVAGTFVTLSGTGFGDVAGEVIFLGDENDDADDVRATIPQQCSVGWTDTQVIVAAPDNIVPGPIQLNASGGLFDTTANERGIALNFSLSDSVYPGLCSVDPLEGEPGTLLTLKGQGFASSGGRVLLGQTSATVAGQWTDTEITGVKVPFMSAGIVPLKVSVSGNPSNSIDFKVNESETVPFIDRISPASGPVGQYVTIWGRNFGNTIGAVRFISSSGEEALADTSFPEACGTDYWTGDYVIVKVPSAQNGDYRVRVDQDVAVSNELEFTINNNQLTPGICKVSPDNGPAHTDVLISGDGFGSQVGSTMFYNRQDNGTIREWTDQQIRVTVAPQGQTGPVYIVNNDGTRSNELPFVVGQCTPTSCGVGSECCLDGSCRPDGQCAGEAPFCQYVYTFSTGLLPEEGSPDAIPQVVEDQNCSSATQSPSPWRSSQDACVNSLVSARFSLDMRDGDLLSNDKIKVERCSTGSLLDSASCNLIVGQFQIINQNTNSEGFVFTPQGGLDANTWYRVTIDASVASAAGVSMTEPYSWEFKTTESSSACTASDVVATPSQAHLGFVGDTQQIDAIPVADNCNILVSNNFTWAWTNDSPDRVGIENTTQSMNTVTGLAETKETPAKVGVSIADTSIAGESEITVDFEDPRIVEIWPNCTAACSNAEIGAQFNIPMNPNSFNVNNVSLSFCEDDACSQLAPVNIASLIYDDTTRTLSIQPQEQLLTADLRYRVIINGGLSGPVSASNVPLANLNYSPSGGSRDTAYSWVFKTKEGDALCSVDHVDLSPTYQALYLIGAEQSYTSQPYGSPDQCSDKGQRLKASSYNYLWSSSNQSVATISQENILPEAAVDGNTDNIQIATAQGEGSTTIASQETRTNVSGDAQLDVICGYTRDTQCPLPATVSSHGVGSDSCCWPRPQIVENMPPTNAQNICRNALITFTFDQIVDRDSITKNVLVEYNNQDQACPAGSASLMSRIFAFVKNMLVKETDAAQPGDIWCPLTDLALSTQVIGGQTLVQIRPNKIFDENEEYRVRINGDSNLNDAIKEGVVNNVGVAMTSTQNTDNSGDYIWIFETDASICEIAYVDMTLTRKIDGVLQSDKTIYDLFHCAGRDDCSDDVDPSKSGNQHRYSGLARDASGLPIAADYTWFATGEPVINMEIAGPQEVLVTPRPDNGEATVTVQASSEGKTVTRSIFANVYICENPWPSLRDYPFIDTATNFSMLYCRDKNEPGFEDDLPDLVFPPVETAPRGDIIKEYFFFVR